MYPISKRHLKGAMGNGDLILAEILDHNQVFDSTRGRALDLAQRVYEFIDGSHRVRRC